MQVWHSSSTSSKPCVVCGKVTGHYKVYEQCGITLSLPLCDRDYPEKRDCYQRIDIKTFATGVLTSIKSMVKHQAQ